MIFNRKAIAGSIAITVAGSIFLGSAWASAQSDGATQAPTHKDNRRMEKTVLKALLKNKIDTSHLVVLAKGSSIVLEGTVQDAESIDRTSKIAGMVPGVTSVQNAIMIREEGR